MMIMMIMMIMIMIFNDDVENDSGDDAYGNNKAVLLPLHTYHLIYPV